MWNDLSHTWQVGVTVALVVGGVFVLVGAVGLIRFDDFFMRLHSPTKATTLGVGSLLVASIMASAAHGHWSASELLVGLFLFVTAPVSASLLAKAAIHRRRASSALSASDHVGDAPDATPSQM
jgi:multicomponent K+:H+ antiporter subunit G